VEELDLQSFESVRQFVKRTEERFPVLDLLVNNAGIMMFEREETVDGHEAMLQTNCLSPFLLTLLLLPRLRLSKLPRGARIINVSSSTCRLIQNFQFDDMEAKNYFSMFYTYGHSKFCLNQFTFELARKLQGTASVNTCHPGTVQTSVTRHLHWFFRLGQYLIRSLNKSALEGAQTILHLSTAKSLRGTTGKYYEHCESVVIARANHEDVTKFIEMAEKLTGIQLPSTM